jgi:hypothetical protein
VYPKLEMMISIITVQGHLTAFRMIILASHLSVRASFSFSSHCVIVLLCYSLRCVGLFWGGVDTLGNCLMIETHGDESRPYVQALHFSFALGAFASPLIVKPFISPHDPVTHDISTVRDALNRCLNYEKP